MMVDGLSVGLCPRKYVLRFRVKVRVKVRVKGLVYFRWVQPLNGLVSP